MKVRPRRRAVAAAVAAVAVGAAVFAGVAQSQASGPPVNTGAPIVLGSFQAGSTLSVLSGAWNGNPFSFSYQWESCTPVGPVCTPIPGATAATYQVAPGDAADLIRVQVTATNFEGSSAPVFSASVGPVVLDGAPVSNTPPGIQGDVPPVVGQALNGTPGFWSNAAGFGWQWLRCNASGGNCAVIPSATSPTYTPNTADVDSTLRLLVSATSVGPPAGGAQAISAPTQAVDRAGPENTARPTISGTPRLGQTLTASNGSWQGQAPITFSLQWQRCNAQGQACQAIPGATQQSYALTSADQGSTIVVVVTARNADGTATASSQAVGPVTGVPAGQTVPVTDVSLPNRLVVSASEFVPAVLHSRAPFTARFRIMDTEGHFVSGVQVFLSVIPFGRVAPAGTQTTDQNGWATFTLQPTAKFPLRKGYLITIFVRATKPGDDLLAGVSARRLVSVNINPNR